MARLRLLSAVVLMKCRLVVHIRVVLEHQNEDFADEWSVSGLHFIHEFAHSR